MRRAFLPPSSSQGHKRRVVVVRVRIDKDATRHESTATHAVYVYRAGQRNARPLRCRGSSHERRVSRSRVASLCHRR